MMPTAHESRHPHQTVYALMAIACLLGAAAVLWATGLPDRARYTGTRSENGQVYAAEPGALAPLFTLASADGPDLALDALRGRPVILNFWATWCGPCAVEMPELQRLQDTFGDALTVVGVNTGESRAIVQAWADDRDVTFPLVLDTSNRVAAAYQLRGQPTTFVLDADGRIVDILYGPSSFTDLSRRVEPLLTPAT